MVIFFFFIILYLWFYYFPQKFEIPYKIQGHYLTVWGLQKPMSITALLLTLIMLLDKWLLQINVLR